MNILSRLWKSSLGKKYLMAITGVLLFLFLIGHMIGNLQIFLGREAINRYAHFLQSNLELLWPVRIILIACVVIHIWTSIVLYFENKKARPAKYEEPKLVGASLASRTMIWTGLIVAAFIIYHLLHFTARVPAINMTGNDFHTLKEEVHVGKLYGVQGDGYVAELQPDVYSMMIVGFQQPLVSLFYVISLGLLCFHLSHGAASWFQTLGLKNAAYTKAIERFALIASWVLFLGYSSVPLAVLLRIVK